ncbi:hypothetical protein SAMN04487949_2827 [Halogranum gelatinilyticum]|uniref:Uncharacterized protein n=1 Tax=Halogranum gelatinilyticum TaxID=660521 RepID=A0A1G9X3R3_9EURY|nr:hypothetical protein [Halogranum gelatinilyticum]SDM91358.1 hypothetical protein SAMN04487949_2827 [Halogranum gelatinilyticum]
MVGTTLAAIREHVESLAAPDGRYVVHCSRTGERPVPVAGKRFASRTLAERAVAAATQYRAALRRYDPQLPHYALVVSHETGVYGTDSRDRDTDETAAPTLEPSADSAAVGQPPLVEFCHQVAASVFEALCDAGHRAVETAVMDAYFELAETVRDPDELCLCLLESMAAELDSRLTPSEQADVLAEAATLLPAAESNDDAVSAALATLEGNGLLSAYRCGPPSVDLDSGTRTIVVRVSDYALSPRDGRLPVLPLVLGVYRRESAWPLSSVRVIDDDDWQLTLVHSRDGGPSDLTSVPIESAV